MPLRFAVLPLVVPLALAKAAPVPTHTAHELGYYYATAVGTTWVYEGKIVDEDWTLTITKVVDEKDKASKLITIAEVGKDGKAKPSEVLRISPKGVWKVQEIKLKGLIDIDEPLCQLSLTHRPGEWWDEAGEGWGKNVSRAAEVVKVPAGWFRAIPVTGDGYVTAGNERVTMTLWYARNVGVVKGECRRDNKPDGEWVLKSFKPGKK